MVLAALLASVAAGSKAAAQDPIPIGDPTTVDLKAIATVAAKQSVIDFELKNPGTKKLAIIDYLVELKIGTITVKPDDCIRKGGNDTTGQIVTLKPGNTV